MVIFTKEELYNFLLKQYKINETEDIEKKRLYQDNLEEFINEIYDMSKTIVSPLNERTTFIFRKRYGVMDGGVRQTQNTIGEELGISRAAAYQLLKKIESVIPQRIKKEVKEPTGFSVFDIYEDKRHLSTLPVGQLEIPTTSSSRLIKRGILTLGDLLNHSFRNLFSYKEMHQSPVVEAVHNLGLKFIDEIAYKERKKLFINCSDRDKVLNSDISWLGIDHKLERKLTRIGVNKIKDLYTFNINIGEINIILENFGNELKDEMVDISGYNRDTEFRMLSNNEITMQPLTINELNFTTRAINALSLLGITSIEDVTNMIRRDLLSIPYVGTTAFTEIVNKAHSCGFKFADELSKEETMTYMKELEESLGEEERQHLNITIDRMDLSNRTYNALSNAKIKTMRQLIVISTADLTKIKGIGGKSYQEVIDKVHGYGLMFVDEEIKARIEDSKELDSLIERNHKMVSKYNELTFEKTELLLASEKLDGEITDTIALIEGNVDKKTAIKKKTQ